MQSAAIHSLGQLDRFRTFTVAFVKNSLCASLSFNSWLSFSSGTVNKILFGGPEFTAAKWSSGPASNELWPEKQLDLFGMLHYSDKLFS